MLFVYAPVLLALYILSTIVYTKVYRYNLYCGYIDLVLSVPVRIVRYSVDVCSNTAIVFIKLAGYIVGCISHSLCAVNSLSQHAQQSTVNSQQ